MVEFRTGYCPVHDREVTVEITYSDMKVSGTKTAQKHRSGEKCAVWDLTNPKCSNCPLLYGNNGETL